MRKLSMLGLLCAATLCVGTSQLRAEEAPQVLAAVKFPPLKKLTAEVMGVARKLSPGQQTEFLPMMALGPFGYPNYPGVSETEPVTVFFFEPQKGEPTPYVILSKMESTSLIKTALTMKSQGGNSMFAFLTPGLSVTERDGWTLFAENEAAFDYATDVDALVDLSNEISGFDVTARFFIGPERIAKWVELMKDEIAEAHVLNGGAESDPALLHKQLWVEFLATIGENLAWSGMGLDISQETLSLGFSVQAIKDTPEFEALSMPVGGEAQVGDFVAASTISFLSKWDMPAAQKYYDVLEARGLKIATDGGKEWITKAGAYNREFYAKLDGTHAGTMSFSDETPVSTNAMGGSFDADTLDRVMHFYYDELIPYLMKEYTPPEQQGLVELLYKSKVGEAAGQPVFEVESKTPDVAPTLDEGDTTEFMTEQTYFAAVDGDLLGSTEMSDLEALAQRVSKAEPADGSVAQCIQLKPGEAMQMQVDVRSLVKLMNQEFEPESEVARQSMRKLAKSELAPLTGALTIGQGQGVYRLTAPVSTLEKFAEAQRQIKQAEDDMSHGGSQPAFPVTGEGGQ
ncbi:hypothetical protein [Cerasicoccus maritimus]|uniref:hypothetical protein n=1 Tax=Cerasicoccus maritimus TaxID=490089 RepID=UPI002852531B|nr:hypothetical protein [Cerasicoccus maritimus]